MYDTTTQQQEQSVKCGVCGIQAAIKSVRFGIRGETLINAIHGSKNSRAVVEHSWTTFSPDKFLIPTVPTTRGATERPLTITPEVNDVKKPRDPLMIKCPRCSKYGRVNEYHPRKSSRPDVTRFYVKHEYIGGYWGKVEKVKRFRRCYFSRESIIPHMSIT